MHDHLWAVHSITINSTILLSCHRRDRIKRSREINQMMRDYISTMYLLSHLIFVHTHRYVTWGAHGTAPTHDSIINVSLSRNTVETRHRSLLGLVCAVHTEFKQRDFSCLGIFCPNWAFSLRIFHARTVNWPNEASSVTELVLVGWTKPSICTPNCELNAKNELAVWVRGTKYKITALSYLPYVCNGCNWEFFVPLEMFSTHTSMDRYDEDNHYWCSVLVMKLFG